MNLKNKIKYRGVLFILSAPSGSGKSTLVKSLVEENNTLKTAVSATTRAKRDEEVDKVDYFFKSREEFYKLIEQHKFLEYSEVYGNFYGTLKTEINNKLEQGFDVIIDIDWQGATLIKDRMPNDTVSIFMIPPSFKELERRIKTRNQDSEDIIRYRMAKARGEVALYYKYDYLIINDSLQEVKQDISSIIKCHQQKISRMSNMKELIDKM